VRPSTAKRIQFLFSPVIRSGFVACKFGRAAEKPPNGDRCSPDPVTIERRRLKSIYRITSSFTGPCTIPVDSVGIVLAALDNSTWGQEVHPISFRLGIASPPVRPANLIA